MTDPTDKDAGVAAAPTEPAPKGLTAGAALRQAREARGLHVAAFAATLKIPQRKVEALEADRYDELPDLAFTRALAKSACRALKLDPEPVLALLPKPDGASLDQVSGGLNTPFRESGEGAGAPPWLQSPVTWVVLVLAIGALAMLMWPRMGAGPAVSADATIAPTMAASSASASAEAEAGSGVVPAPADDGRAEPAGAAVTPEPGRPEAATARALGSAPGAPVTGVVAPGAQSGAATLVVEVAQASWLQVTDADGRLWVSRTLQPADGAVQIQAQPPLQVVVGNVGATRLRWRGDSVALDASARGNVARIELR